MPSFGLINYNLGSLDLPGVFQFAKEAGFSHIELMSGHVWDEKKGEDLDTAKRRAEQVAAQLADHGLLLSAFGAGNDFVVLDEAEVERQVERMKGICELAKILGTQILRTEGGRPKPEVPEDRWVEAMAGCLKRCVPFIEADQIYLAVDNHGIVTNDADLQVRLLESVGSPFVRATMDTMNYRWAGHDLDTVRRFYRTIAPYVVHLHFKDGRGSRSEYVGDALGEGEIDLKSAVDALVEVGYQGVWTVEYEGKTDPQEGYRKGLAWLKAHVPS